MSGPVNVYTVGTGTAPINRPIVIQSGPAPGAATTGYPVGTVLVIEATNTAYVLTSKTTSNGTVSANWTTVSTAAGDIDSITTDDSTIVLPVSGNVNLAGASGQLVTSGSGATATVSIASPATAPAAFTVTGLLTGLAGITTSGGATNVNSGTNATNISTDASATTVSLGTGAAAKAVTVGSTNTTSSTTVQSGATGSISVNSNGGTLGILSGTGVMSISADAAATTVNIGTGAAAKAVTLGSTNTTSATTVQSGSGALNITGTNGAITVASGTGEIDISADAAATTVKLATGAGAKALTVGSTNTTSATTLQSGSGGIAIATGTTAGNVSITPATNSAAGVSLTLNGRVGQATFTGQTTASGSSQDFVITNSSISGTTQAIFVSADNLGANDAQMTITRVLQAASTLTVTLKNNGAAALNGDVHINFWILN